MMSRRFKITKLLLFIGQVAAVIICSVGKFVQPDVGLLGGGMVTWGFILFFITTFGHYFNMLEEMY